jgi:multiple sugar transport system ATP-binding protein
VPPQLRDSTGRHVVLGVRPEDVFDATEGCDPEFVALPATVLAIEHTGPEKVVTVAVAAPPVAAPGADPADARAGRARLRCRFPAKAEVRRGGVVQVAVDAARAHVFDATTGQALWHPDSPA